MKLNNALIYPINKVPTYTKKESLNKRASSIINIILPGHKKGLSSFKISKKLMPKLFLSKKRYSLKNINSNPKLLSLKSNDSTLYLKEQKLTKSNSSHPAKIEENLNEINYKKRKNTSFYNQNNNNNIEKKTTQNSNFKNETFSNVKLIIKNARSFSSSRNINYFTNSDELIHVNKNNNNNIILNRNNKKLRIKKKSSLFKNKNNFICNIKTSINLSFCDNDKNDIYFYNGYKITRNKIPEKIYKKIKTNISDKENINNQNISNLNESNINESLFLSKPIKNTKKKINLPFSPTSNREQFYKQIKYKKYYIRNNKNETESNIPFRKNTKLTKQNSFYNSNSNSNLIFKIKDNKKLNDLKKEDSNSIVDIDIFNKNSSMSFFGIDKKANANPYSNSELCISTNENNFEYKAKYLVNEVEMNHFKIVKIIQNNKLMLIKNENNI